MGCGDGIGNWAGVSEGTGHGEGSEDESDFMVLNLMKLFGYVGYGGCSTDLKR